jgi:methyltransferase-like protein
VSEEKLSFKDLLKSSMEASKPKGADNDSEKMEIISSSVQDQELSDGRIIYELTDVVEEESPKSITVAEFNAEIMKKVSEIAERISRELIPGIAERIIREEIEKLKAADE